MSFNVTELGEFLNRYSTLGDTIKIDTHQLEEASLMGHGELYLPNRTLDFTVMMVTDPHITETICMTEVDDFGGFEIVMHFNHVLPMPDLKINRRMIEVACIRQLARLAIDEMPAQYKDINHSTLGLGQLYKAFPAVLDYRPELQAFFRNQFVETENAGYKHNYFNQIAEALVMGGVCIREYEVDLEVLRFFNTDDICFYHWLTVRSNMNPAIQKEVSNRTSRLLTVGGWNGEVLHPEFELQLYLP